MGTILKQYRTPEPSADTVRLDAVLAWLPWLTRHRLGGDLAEMREGIDAGILFGAAYNPFTRTEKL